MYYLFDMSNILFKLRPTIFLFNDMQSEQPFIADTASLAEVMQQEAEPSATSILGRFAHYQQERRAAVKPVVDGLNAERIATEHERN